MDPTLGASFDHVARAAKINDGHQPLRSMRLRIGSNFLGSSNGKTTALHPVLADGVIE
jgi:hypothetical protein